MTVAGFFVRFVLAAVLIGLGATLAVAVAPSVGIDGPVLPPGWGATAAFLALAVVALVGGTTWAFVRLDRA